MKIIQLYISSHLRNTIGYIKGNNKINSNIQSKRIIKNMGSWDNSSSGNGGGSKYCWVSMSYY